MSNPVDVKAIRERADDLREQVTRWISEPEPDLPFGYTIPLSPDDGFWLLDQLAALLADRAALLEALTEVAEHPVVNRGDPNQDCDWHCTITLVGRAKDALARLSSENPAGSAL